MENKKQYHSIYISAHNNAVDLLSEAEILYSSKRYARAYFLAFSALEEISKSQLAADVFTGFRKSDEFWKSYCKHDLKIKNIRWATLDANTSPYNIDINGGLIHIDKPTIKKRMDALYVHLNKQGNIICPKDKIQKQDAKDLIHTVNVAIHQIHLMTEHYGHQIGTKGFMK